MNKQITPEATPVDPSNVGPLLQVYNSEIKPLVDQLDEALKKHRMPLAMVVGLDKTHDGQAFRSIVRNGEDRDPSMHITFLTLAMGDIFDPSNRVWMPNLSCKASIV